MDMTLAQFKGFVAATARLENGAMGRAALAARTAFGADKKGWAQFLEDCAGSDDDAGNGD